MPEIQTMSVKHDAILNYMIANPNASKAEVAAAFEVTQPWLSCIIHSRAFQERLAIRREQIFAGHIMPLQEKLLGLAHTAVERLHDMVNVIPDPEFIAETTINVLDRLGYSPKARGVGPEGGTMNVQQNNYYVVDKETLANARANMGRAAAERGNVIEAALPAPELHPGRDC